jgi:hypothetical protein
MQSCKIYLRRDNSERLPEAWRLSNFFKTTKALWYSILQDLEGAILLRHVFVNRLYNKGTFCLSHRVSRVRLYLHYHSNHQAWLL